MPLSKLSILYVEDEPEIVSLMKELLEDEVKTLYIANNGEEGLKMYEEFRPDIILSDIYMPKVDGLTMSKIIKERFPEQAIVLLTAFSNVDDFKRAIDIGIDSYINKPILSEEQLNAPLLKIAKRIQEKKQFEILNKQIQQQNKYAAIGEILGLITHQWKQPISSIAAKLAAIQIKTQLGTLNQEDINTFITLTAERIQFLSQTISDFKDYLKPKEMAKPFNLNELYIQIYSLMQDKLFDEKVTLIFPGNDIDFMGFKNKLVHVFMNLINNSCDAMREHEEKYLFIEVEDGDKCRFLIRDSAGGIKEEYLNTIFQPYVTTKDEEYGAGLGLYMVREFIVGHMGGDIKVKNISYEYNGKTLHGAQFEIIIPKSINTVLSGAL